MKLLAAVTDEKDFNRIPELLRNAGIQCDNTIFGTNDRVHRCRRGGAAVTVAAVATKAPWDEFLSDVDCGTLRDKVERDIKQGDEAHFYSMFIDPEPGLLRSLFRGKSDLELQLAVARALE